ncbi:hypothetical protein BaRGS_00019833, partial [Batillaria attramentaria]
MAKSIKQKRPLSVSTCTPVNDFNSAELQGMNDESELQDFSTTGRLRWAAVMFTNLGQNTTLPQHVAFSLSSPKWSNLQIRYNYYKYERGHNYEIILQPPEDSYIIPKDHLALQSSLTETLISMWSGNDVSFELTMNMMPFPSRWGGRGRAGHVWNKTFRLQELLVVSFILSVVQATKDVVAEKENKIKELMKLMGMLPSAYWASWFVSSSACVAIVIPVCTAFMCTTIVAPLPLLDHADISVYCVFLLCFAAALVSYGIMMSVFFTRATMAAIVSGAVFFLSFLPAYFATTYREKMAGSLSFTTATKFGRVGITWSNYDKAVYPNPWSLYDSMLMLLLDTALHLIITLYLDAVLPSEYGVPEPFYFFLTVSLMNPIPSDESHPCCVFLTVSLMNPIPSDQSHPFCFFLTVSLTNPIRSHPIYFLSVSMMSPVRSTSSSRESDESYPFNVLLAVSLMNPIRSTSSPR